MAIDTLNKRSSAGSIRPFRVQHATPGTTAGNATRRQNAGFYAGLTTPPLPVSTITANPTSVPPNGTTASTITVTIRDSSGVVVSGATVTLHTSPASETGDGTTAVTNGSGVATFSVTESEPETVVYTATTSAGLAPAGSATVTFGGSHHRHLYVSLSLSM